MSSIELLHNCCSAVRPISVAVRHLGPSGAAYVHILDRFIHISGPPLPSFPAVIDAAVVFVQNIHHSDPPITSRAEITPQRPTYHSRPSVGHQSSAQSLHRHSWAAPFVVAGGRTGVAGYEGRIRASTERLSHTCSRGPSGRSSARNLPPYVRPPFPFPAGDWTAAEAFRSSMQTSLRPDSVADRHPLLRSLLALPSTCPRSTTLPTYLLLNPSTKLS